MGDFIAVTVTEIRGSAPREAGATMAVWPDRIDGSIGGGRLEWDAIADARDMLKTGETGRRRSYALGPDLGQCCGGVVTLDFVSGAQTQAPSALPLVIWGAGHVGRAILRVMEPFGDRIIYLADTGPERLPEDLGPLVRPLVSRDLVQAVPHLDAKAHHIIVTYSHDFDLNLCDALLRHGFETCGLIGSATKWARFRKRLGAMGHSEAQIARITCPIGNKSLGKHPQAIAIGVVSAIVKPERGTIDE